MARSETAESAECPTMNRVRFAHTPGISGNNKNTQNVHRTRTHK